MWIVNLVWWSYCTKVTDNDCVGNLYPWYAFVINVQLYLPSHFSHVTLCKDIIFGDVKHSLSAQFNATVRVPESIVYFDCHKVLSKYESIGYLLWQPREEGWGVTSKWGQIWGMTDASLKAYHRKIMNFEFWTGCNCEVDLMWFFCLLNFDICKARNHTEMFPYCSVLL